MTDSGNKWYVKKAGQVSGPFSTQVISNNLKLGRLSETDEVSSDKISWKMLKLAGQLFSIHSLNQTTFSLDERDGFDRRQAQSPEHTAKFNSRRQFDRRSPEKYSQILRRQLRTELLKKYRESTHYSIWPLAVLITAILLTVLLAITYPTKYPTPSANCDTPATAFVDWSNCKKMYIDLTGMNLTGASLTNSQLISAKLMNTNLEGADLAYTDLHLSDLSYSFLTKATLVGANLQNVDLSYADLSNSNLSFANLAGANIGQAKLDGTLLANAIWIDGSVCAENAIGECTPRP